MNSNNKAAYDSIVRELGSKLAPSGYRQRGKVLRRTCGGNLGVIEFQASTGNSMEVFRFTITIGVVCGAIPLSRNTAIENATILDSHLSMRLGELMPAARDIWWQLGDERSNVMLLDEVSGALDSYAVPFLEKYVETRELVMLWKSGKSPGLTAVQRNRYLARLIEAHPEFA